MNPLQLPERLKGAWEHVLILTYGLDAVFFENALWRQFSARCRNKIILADGQRYLDACSGYARGGMVRHLNQRYVAEGIYTSRAAHAKAILLANQEQGRLLVGSGNLGWQGYASGGELFTEYTYSAADPAALPAFLAVRELVDGLATRGYLTPPAQRRLRHLWEHTPWFYQAASAGYRPVRHNLTTSFLTQLTEAVAGEPVEELWIAAPFYDPQLIALERLLETLHPHRTCLLVQSGYTSLNLEALTKLSARWPAGLEIYTCKRDEANPYLHAKLYLLKFCDRALCLQGSPNLSQVAMLWPVPQGNVELANLLEGARDDYDSLLAVLNPEQVKDLATLDVAYQPPTSAEFTQVEGWYLTGGEWRDDRLRLHYHGTLPELAGVRVLVGNQTVVPTACRQEARSLEFQLPPETVSALNHPLPITLFWPTIETRSNPVYICNQAALDAELEIRTDDADTLDRIGGFDLVDEELEQLLADLDAALVIDRQSVWQLAGRRVTLPDDADDEELRLGYEDIDYEQLRQHPKLRQYLQKRQPGERYTRSRLQIILSSITDHFRGLLDGRSQVSVKMLEALQMPGSEEGETEDEIEAADADKKRRRQAQGKRLARLFKNFVRRYLRGLRSLDFQDFAGFVVLTDNYIIFSHLLWHLFRYEWLEPQFIIKSLLETWQFFWGTAYRSGYFAALEPEYREQAYQLLRGDYAVGEQLAALYHSAHLTRTEGWDDLRFALRDFWRAYITTQPLPITSQTLETAWRIVAERQVYEPPRPPSIIEELVALAGFETSESFRRALEEQFDLSEGGCYFERVKVHCRVRPVNCMVLTQCQPLQEQRSALELLAHWLQQESLDYYRVCCPATHSTDYLLFYDVLNATGTYWAKAAGQDPVDFSGPLMPAALPWDEILAQLQSLAQELDGRLVFPKELHFAPQRHSPATSS